MHAEMAARFLGPDHPIVFSGVDALRPGSDNFLCVPAILEFATFYRVTDRPRVLKHQIKSLQDLIGETKPDLFGSQLLLLKFVMRYCDAFNLVAKVISIALTIPASSSSAERSFSALKRIKTFLRSTMTNERLSNIALLSIHATRTKALNEDKIVDNFANLAKRRHQLTF